jgi:hypothetical protein
MPIAEQELVEDQPHTESDQLASLEDSSMKKSLSAHW